MATMTTNVELWKTWEGRAAGEKYPMRQWLGGSDHSAVFLTERSGEGSQKAAIKLILAGANPEQQLTRWRDAAKLSHPHLIPIFDCGQCQIDDAPLLYVVTEFAEEDLSQILPQRALTPAETADMLPPILDAVSYLHGQGFVHNAIKPANLLAAGDQLKLSTDRVRRIGEIMAPSANRTAYDAPEITTAELSPTVDVWSIGATLVEALTQKPPAYNVVEQKEPVVPTSIPEPFRGIARECLRRDVMQRCTIADIRTWRPPDSESAPAVVPPEPTRKYPRTTWHIVIPIAILLLFGLAIPIFHTIFDSKKPSNGQVYYEQVEKAPSSSQSAPKPAEPTPQASASAPAPTASQGNSSAAAQPAANKPSASARSAATQLAPIVTAPPTEAPKQTPPRSAPAGDVIRRVLPEVPHSASRTISGTIKVTVHVDVDSSGKVSAAKITHAGSSAYFNRLALQAAERWEFSPPQVHGQPTSSAWNLRFQFKRSGTQAFSAKAR